MNSSERKAEGRVARPGTAPLPGGGGVLLAALLLTLVLRILATFLSSNWLWGLDTFHHWPPLLASVLIALALVGFIPAAGLRLESGLQRLGSIWERAGLGGDMAVSAGVAVLLFLLRDPVRFPGDSSLRLGMVSASLATMKQLAALNYPLDVLVNLYLPRILWQQGMSPETALQLVGAVMGGIFALTCCAFLRAAGARGATFPVAALVLLGGAAFIHFAGYDKFGPYMVGLALAGTGAAGLARRGRGEVCLVAGAVVCALSHRSAYLILPALAWTLFRAWRAAPDRSGRLRVVVASALALVPFAVLFPHTLGLVLRVDRAVHLPGGAEAHSRGEVGAPAALLRISNGLNALFFLVPLWLVGPAAAWLTRRPVAAAAERPKPGSRWHTFSLAQTAWLALAAYAALLFGFEPGGSWPRDWDDGTPVAVVVGLAVAYALIASRRRTGAPGAEAPAASLAIAVCIALWGVHVSEGIGLRRVETLLGARPALSNFTRAQAYDFLGMRALNAGQSDHAAECFEHSLACARNPRVYYQAGLAYLGGGRLERAAVAFHECALRNRGLADPWVGLARVALAAGDTVAALARLDSALVRQPGNAEGQRLHGLLRIARAGIPHRGWAGGP